MTGHIQRLHHGVSTLFACLEDALKHVCQDLETALGGRTAHPSQHGLKGAQGLSSPIDTPLAHQALRDGMPLRAACGIMTPRDTQTQGIAQLALQLCFPKARTTAVPAARIGQAQQACRLGIRRLPVFLPPTRARCNSKRGGIRRLANVDAPCMSLPIEEAIRRHTAKGVGQTIRHGDGVSVLTPGLSSVLEVAKTCLFLGIHPDVRITGSGQGLLLGLNRPARGLALRGR
jgi:hypothetical protein